MLAIKGSPKPPFSRVRLTNRSRIRRRLSPTPAAPWLTLVVFLAVLPFPTLAQEPSRRSTEKIVEKRISVDGQPPGEVRVEKKIVFVNDEGQLVELDGEGDGNTFSWSFEGDVLRLGGGDAPGDSKAEVWLSALGLGNGYLGLELTPLTDALRRHFGVEEGSGVLVAEVVEGSPAHRAGLDVGDIITRASGEPIVTPRDLTRAVRSRKKDDTLDLELVRGGHALALTATVGEHQRPRVKLGRHGSHLQLEHLSEPSDDGVVVILDDAVGQLRQYLEGDEWKARLRLLESNEWTSIEDRMQEVQRQLQELEKKIREAEPEG